MTLLLLEDQALIVMDIADALERAGFAVVALPSVSQAEAWLNEHTPQAAIVDCFLGDGSSACVVERLRSLQVPVIIYTGVSQEELDPAFKGLELHAKPAAAQDLIAAIELAVGRDQKRYRGLT